MSRATEDLTEFAQLVAENYAEALSAVAPGDDPVPTLFVADREKNLNLVAIDRLDNDIKDVLFGQVFPDVIDHHDGEKAAFLSFAWQTEISDSERAELRKILEERGIERTDSAALRRILEEDLGIKISGEDRRKEVCQMVCVSPEAEAMWTAYVERDGETPPHIAWDMEGREQNGTKTTGFDVSDRFVDGEREGNFGFSGRVIEGLRDGVDRVQNRMDDWRTE